MATNVQSKRCFDEAKRFFPGGVNSPVRAFGSVGGNPVFFKKALGAYMWDVDNNKYIDYIGSWGPAILGHCDPMVEKAINKTLSSGFSFGAPTEIETALAVKINELMPNLEMMRFVSSGTEACMSALRLARGFTKRQKVLKFTGCYHGHADMFLVAAGSGVATLGIPGSPGVPDAVVADTLTCPYNDAEAVAEIFKTHGKDLAAVILEPYVGNSGFIRAEPEFLSTIREKCDQSGALLIYDEVMTGFRVHLNGAQSIHNIKPDLTTLGKIVGGGLPVGVYGGRKDVMKSIAPDGPIYQAGTLSGHPAAMAAGLTTLQEISKPGRFDELRSRTERLTTQLLEIHKKMKVPFSADHEGGMFGFFFSEEKVRNFDGASAANIEYFKRFFHGCLQRGIYFAPSPYEAGFVSMSHSEEDIATTVRICEEVSAELSS
ncbi:glutamate-1-semialdehyde 2,1-aminomutase [Oligoflexaceae bacterium]|nr:glutamate-1-semialdehyde 2,1-aminomutase [Oligoflexaceae bacterium]